MNEIHFNPDNKEMVVSLMKMPVLECLNQRQLEAVMKYCSLRQYAKGERVVREGELDQWVYFLIAGELSVRRKGVELGRIDMLGSVFGEMGVIDGSPRSATISAASKSLCLAVDASFMEHLEDSDQILVQAVLFRAFCEKMAGDLRLCNDRVAAMQKKLLQIKRAYPKIEI